MEQTLTDTPRCQLLAADLDVARFHEFNSKVTPDSDYRFPSGNFLAIRLTPPDMRFLADEFEALVEPHIGKVKVGVVGLLRMGPGDELPIHKDPHVGRWESDFPTRMHLVISARPGCRFYIDGETIEHREGDLWSIRGVSTVNHGARNDSDGFRTIGVFDVTGFQA